MGNRLKSKTEKLYNQRVDRILAQSQNQQANSTPKYNDNKNNNNNCGISGNKSMISKNPKAFKSIISSKSINEDLEQIKNETLNKIIENYYNINIKKQENCDLNESIASNIDSEERRDYAYKLCINIDKYCYQIIKELQTYNLEMKMEIITQQNWINFCSDLEKCSFLPKITSPKKNGFQKQEEQRLSYRTLPLYKNFSEIARVKAVNLNQYSSSATNLDERPIKKQQSNLPIQIEGRQGNNCYKQDELSQISNEQVKKLSGTKSSSISSFLGDRALLSFNTQIHNNQRDLLQSQHYNDSPLNEEEKSLKDDLKKFRSYMRESDEIFTMFRKISAVFQQTFFSLYGKNNKKAPKEYMADPQLLENRLSFEIRFIVRVFELLIERMMDHFMKIQGSDQENFSTFIKKSFMSSIEYKAFPIINLLLTFNNKVFERIRELMSLVNKDQANKLQENIQFYLKQKLYQQQIIQLRSIKVPYQKSIEEYKKVSIIFSKNILLGVKYLQNVVKPIIMNEITENKLIQNELKKQQSNSCLQSTSLITPQSQAERCTIQIQTIKLSLTKNSLIESHQASQIDYKQSTFNNQAIQEEQDEFYLRQDSKSKVIPFAQSEITELLRQNSSNPQTEQDASPIINFRNQDNNSMTQTKFYGADDLAPIYEYVVSQAESQMQTTLFFDFKLFVLIFDNLQDRIPTYSSQIQNVSSFLATYNYLLSLKDQNNTDQSKLKQQLEQF